MKILIIHNHYSLPGGEDVVVDSESRLLKEHGHDVFVYTSRNHDLEQWSLLRKGKFLFKDAFWSEYFYRDLTAVIKRYKPEIAHIHNPFYLFSPSIYDACRQQNVPIVQTLHNYRFLCPAATFFRDGHICHDCTRKGLHQAVVHSCWQQSISKTFFLTQIIQAYRRLQIPQSYVSTFIAPSIFTKSMFVQSGWPVEKITVKPNLVFPFEGPTPERENFILFVGALYAYKGIETLLQAWSQDQGPCLLKIIGDGPLKDRVMKHVGKKVEYWGHLPAQEVRLMMARASAVVIPSLCYETFSRVIAEAYSCGTPVIASDLGALKELVIDRQTGLLFSPGDDRDLRKKIIQLLSDESMTIAMGNASQAFFEKHLGAEANYSQLMNIYKNTISS